jgi:hypothetical protein
MLRVVSQLVNCLKPTISVLNEVIIGSLTYSLLS